MSTEMTPLMETVVHMNKRENERKDFIPRILLINCETRNRQRLQLAESMWFVKNGVEMRDVIRLIHNQKKSELTQLSLFAGHRMFLDYKGEKIFESYLLTEEARTWWSGDILNASGKLIAKAPAGEVLKLIREIPHDLLIRPENLKSHGIALFSGGFLDYIEKCSCYYCTKHQKLFG